VIITLPRCLKRDDEINGDKSRVINEERDFLKSRPPIHAEQWDSGQDGEQTQDTQHPSFDQKTQPWTYISNIAFFMNKLVAFRRLNLNNRTRHRYN
jgi:hypothetical protein